VTQWYRKLIVFGES